MRRHAASLRGRCPPAQPAAISVGLSQSRQSRRTSKYSAPCPQSHYRTAQSHHRTAAPSPLPLEAAPVPAPPSLIFTKMATRILRLAQSPRRAQELRLGSSACAGRVPLLRNNGAGAFGPVLNAGGGRLNSSQSSFQRPGDQGSLAARLTLANKVTVITGRCSTLHPPESISAGLSSTNRRLSRDRTCFRQRPCDFGD